MNEFIKTKFFCQNENFRGFSTTSEKISGDFTRIKFLQVDIERKEKYTSYMKTKSAYVPNHLSIQDDQSLAVPEKKPHTFITRKQRLFISEYMKDYNPRNAAIRAGYPPTKATRQAYSLLSKPHIAEYLSEQEEEAANRNKVTADYLITRLKAIIDSYGEKTSDRIAAIQLVARLTGFLRDKQIENKQVVVLQQSGFDTNGTYTATVIPPPISDDKNN